MSKHIYLFAILFSTTGFSMQLPEAPSLNDPSFAPSSNVDFDVNYEPETDSDMNDGADDFADLEEAIEQFETSPDFNKAKMN